MQGLKLHNEIKCNYYFSDLYLFILFAVSNKNQSDFTDTNIRDENNKTCS